MSNKKTIQSVTCQHARTHKENIFVDLEDNGKISYDIYEVCDNPDCFESWVIGWFEDNGEEIGKQFFPHLTKGETVRHGI